MRNPSVLTLRRSVRGARLVVGPSAVLLAATGCGAKPAARAPRAPIAVTVVAVRRASVPYEVSATGMVTPMQTAVVVPQVDGIIIDVSFSEGQDVTKGQVLFRIEPRPYQAALDQATAAIRRDRVTAAYAQAGSRPVRHAAAEPQRHPGAGRPGARDGGVGGRDGRRHGNQAAMATRRSSTSTTPRFVHRSMAAPGRCSCISATWCMRLAARRLVVINQVRPTMVRFAIPSSELPNVLHYGARGGLAGDGDVDRRSVGRGGRA